MKLSSLGVRFFIGAEAEGSAFWHAARCCTEPGQSPRTGHPKLQGPWGTLGQPDGTMKQSSWCVTSWKLDKQLLKFRLSGHRKPPQDQAKAKGGRGQGQTPTQQLCLKTKHTRLVSRSHPDGEKCLWISDGLWFMDVYGRASATTIAVHAHESCVFVKLAPGVRCDALEAENTRIRCLVGWIQANINKSCMIKM